MKHTIFTTEGGEELVILSRRDFDALLAAAGDDAAEDRMAARIYEEAKARLASGKDQLAPTIGACIKAKRKKLGLSQMQLAASVEIGQGYLSEIENDAKMPSPDVLKRIAAALGSKSLLIS